MIAFTKPRMTAITAKTVHASDSTRMPGTSQAATKRERLVMAQRMRSFMTSHHFQTSPEATPVCSNAFSSSSRIPSRVTGRGL